MDEKISIIIPVYNIKEYIEKTVQSVLNQTYKNIEIILVDDGSTDGSGEVIDKLVSSDSRIRVIHKENGGVTSARFEGIKAATGEWIGFVDGDDYIEPDMYEKLIDNAHKYNSNISHCGYQMVFPSRVDFYYNTGRLVLQDNLKGLKDLLDGSFIEPGLCNKLFHKTLFHSLLHDDIMDLSIRNTEDLLMNFYLFKESRHSVFEDFCPYHYMVRKGSAATSSVNIHKLEDPLKVLKILEKETEGIPELYSVVFGRLVQNLVNLSTMSVRENEELVRPVRNEARRELRHRIIKIIKSGCKKKQKLFAVWVSVFPGSYRWVHTVYACITETKNRYEVS